MKVQIEYDIIDCRDCPFKHYHYGHGECWYECTNKKAAVKGYDRILWGCGSQFKQIPWWCPYPFPDKGKKS